MLAQRDRNAYPLQRSRMAGLYRLRRRNEGTAGQTHPPSLSRVHHAPHPLQQHPALAPQLPLPVPAPRPRLRHRPADPLPLLPLLLPPPPPFLDFRPPPLALFSPLLRLEGFFAERHRFRSPLSLSRWVVLLLPVRGRGTVEQRLSFRVRRQRRGGLGWFACLELAVGGFELGFADQILLDLLDCVRGQCSVRGGWGVSEVGAGSEIGTFSPVGAVG